MGQEGQLTVSHRLRRPSPPGLSDAAPDPAPSPTHRFGATVLVLVVALGAALRIKQYVFGRSLWFDELFVAINVRDRGFIALTRPLQFHQAAPLGFLWSTKASILAFGQSELAYRLVPLLAGIATVVSVALVARRVFTPVAAVAAAGMVALAGPSIRYASEFKQYTLEAAVAAALLLVALHCLGRTPSEQPRHPALLAVAGALALACSISAVFVMAGIAVVLVVGVIWSRRLFVSVLLIASVWAATAALMYVVSWSKDRRNTALHDYWDAYFGPAPWSRPSWYVSEWSSMVKTQLAISVSWAALALTVLGLLWLARRAPTLATIGVVTVLTTVVASWAGVYPFTGRLLLFLVPTVCLCFAAVVDVVATLVGRVHRGLGWLAASACAVILVSGSVDPAWTAYRHPYQQEEARQVLAAVRTQFRPGDRLYVMPYAQLAFDFYRDRTGFAGVDVVLGERESPLIPGYLRQISALGPGRTWILFSRVVPHTVPGNEALSIRRFLRSETIRTILRPGALAIEIEQKG